MFATERRGDAGAGASLVDMSAFVDLAEKMQTRTEEFADKMQARTEDKIERLREEMKAEKEEMRAEMKAEATAEKEELRRELAPAPVVTDEQLAALEARLEALHAGQLISDDELFAMEVASLTSSRPRRRSKWRRWRSRAPTARLARCTSWWC